MINKSVIINPLKVVMFFATFLLFIACQSSSEKTDVISIGEVTFDVGFDATNRGTVYDNKTNRTLVCFTNLTTYKKIKYFDLNGALVDSLDLKPLFNKKPLLLLGAMDVQFISTDSVIILSSHSANQLVGYSPDTVWLHYDLQEITKKISPHKHDFYFPSRSFQLKEELPLLVYLGHAPDSFLPKDTNVSNWLELHYQESNKCSKILKIDDWSENEPQYSLIPLKNWEKKKNEVVVESSSFFNPIKYINNQYFLSHWQKGLLYKLDGRFQKKDSVVVKSSFTSIGSEFTLVEDLANHTGIHYVANKLSEISYIPKWEKYIISLKYNIRDEKILQKHNITKANIPEKFPFSLLLFDKEFNKLNEIEMNGEKYAFYYYFNTQDAFYLGHRATKNEPYGQYTYTVFDMERH